MKIKWCTPGRNEEIECFSAFYNTATAGAHIPFIMHIIPSSLKVSGQQTQGNLGFQQNPLYFMVVFHANVILTLLFLIMV